MPIIDLQSTKTLLQITETTYDAIIVKLIPMVQEYIVDYTHNQFIGDTFVLTSNIAFVNGSPATITDSEETFLDNYLLNSKDILVEGSYYNDGYYKVHASTAITAGTITLSPEESLKAEDLGASVTIWKVEFPKGIELVAAEMIGYKIHNKKAYQGIQSESIGGGDYSVSYATDKDYPPSILAALRQYRKLYS